MPVLSTEIGGIKLEKITQKTLKKRDNRKNTFSKCKMPTSKKLIVNIIPTTLEECRDDFDSIVDKIIKLNKGLVINSPAGYGKTFLINKLVMKLKNVIKIELAAFTNKAANNFENGKTLHKMLGKGVDDVEAKRYVNVDYIIIDEFTMIPEEFYNDLLCIKRRNPTINIIFVGDMCQIPPVGSIIIDDYFNLIESSLFLELVDYNLLTLKFNHRCKDDPEFCEILDELRKLEDCDNGMVQQKFKKTDKIEKDAKHISFFNNTQKQVNDALMDGDIIIEGGEENQEMRLSVGMPIVAIKACKKLDIYNSEMFIIDFCDNSIIRLTNKDKCIDVKIEEFPKNFTIAYCMTNHKYQGETIEGKLVIYDYPYMTPRMKYTAVSRCKSLKQVYIYGKI